MTGTILTKTGRKNYYAVLNVYGDDGKRRRKWVDTGIPVKGGKKGDATKFLTNLLAEYNDSGVDVTNDVLFVDFMVQWLDTLKLSVSASTFDGYIKNNIKPHIMPYFEPKKLKVKDVTPAVIQKYINDNLAKLSPNTVRKHLFNISQCLDNAVLLSIIAYNPVKRIKMPSPVRFTGAKHYDEKQIEQLLEISKGDPLEIVILLTLFYGLRRSEVLGLRYDSVDFDAKTITIKRAVVIVGGTIFENEHTKNDSSRTIFPIPNKILSRLLEWKEQQEEWKALQPNDYKDNGYICTKPNGELLLPNYVTQYFAKLLKRNNMPHIRFHDLRHSSANYLKYLDFDLKDIQTWLRHKDIQTTMNIYVNLNMQAKSNIADTLNAKFDLLDAK